MMAAAAAAPQLAPPPAAAAAVRQRRGNGLGSKVCAEHCQVHLRIAGRLLEAVRLKKCAFAQSTMVRTTRVPRYRPMVLQHEFYCFSPPSILSALLTHSMMCTLASFATYPDDSNTKGTLRSSLPRRQVHDQLPTIRPLPPLSASPPPGTSTRLRRCRRVH
jgi:hypothetical protein